MAAEFVFKRSGSQWSVYQEGEFLGRAWANGSRLKSRSWSWRSASGVEGRSSSRKNAAEALGRSAS